MALITLLSLKLIFLIDMNKSNEDYKSEILTLDNLLKSYQKESRFWWFSRIPCRNATSLIYKNALSEGFHPILEKISNTYFETL